jgi:hypothetical protein
LNDIQKRIALNLLVEYNQAWFAFGLYRWFRRRLTSRCCGNPDLAGGLHSALAANHRGVGRQFPF